MGKKKSAPVTFTPPPWSLVLDVAGEFGQHAPVGVLEDYSSELLKRIANVFRNGSEVKSRNHKVLARDVRDAVLAEKPCDYVHDLITYLLVMEDEVGTQPLLALHAYRTRGWIPSTPDARVNQKSLALMRATTSLIAESRKATGVSLYGDLPPDHVLVEGKLGRDVFLMLRNAQLVRALWDRHEDEERIIEIINARGNVAGDYIKDMLDSPAASLSEGFL